MTNQKRTLVQEAVARLMATENIIVEHRKINTAAFNVEHRKLLLPIWQDMSDDLYNLLISHEVGHALYTHKTEFMEEIIKPNNWKKKITFNIVEDARIEKSIKKKFPGTKSSFRVGYKELKEKDFFGINGKDIAKEKFLNRINLHYKLGINSLLDVPFSEEEKVWLKRIDSLSSMKETTQLAEELLKYVEDQNEDVDPQQSEDEAEQDGQSGDQEGDSEPGDGEEQIGSGPKSDKKSKSKKNGKDSSEQSTEQEEKDFASSYSNLEENLRKLNDETAPDPVYLTLPDVNLSEVITGHSVVHQQIREHYSSYPKELAEAEKTALTFKHKNKALLSHMVQVFEMKKRAQEHSRVAINKTGMLDLDRVQRYMYNDDIFKRVSVITTGKNHGLVMFLDMSGSMSSNLPGAIEQLLCLVMFCKKVNIPFRVYGFNDNQMEGAGHHSNFGRYNTGQFIIPKGFELREYFSSEMSAFEFNKALVNMFAVYNYYSKEDGHHDNTIPYQERLNGTPLNEAILCAIKIVNLFKAKNKLDIVNTVFISDGASNSSLYYYGENRQVNDIYYKTKIFVRNKTKTYPIDLATSNTGITLHLLSILRDIAHINVIGFFIDESSKLSSNNFKSIMILNTGHESPETTENSVAEYNNKGFFETSLSDGYTVFYLIKGGDRLLINNSAGLNIKNNTYKRLVLSKFIEYIA